MPDPAEVIAWLREHDWKYGQASRHFNIPKALARQWGKEARGLAPSPAPTREDNAELASMSTLERIDWLVAECKRDWMAARDAERQTDKYTALLRGLGKDRDVENVRLQRAGEDAAAAATPEEQIAAIVGLIADAPPALVDAVAEAVEARRNPIRLVK